MHLAIPGRAGQGRLGLAHRLRISGPAIPRRRPGQSHGYNLQLCGRDRAERVSTITVRHTARARRAEHVVSRDLGADARIGYAARPRRSVGDENPLIYMALPRAGAHSRADSAVSIPVTRSKCGHQLGPGLWPPHVVGRFWNSALTPAVESLAERSAGEYAAWRGLTSPRRSNISIPPKRTLTPATADRPGASEPSISRTPCAGHDRAHEPISRDRGWTRLADDWPGPIELQPPPEERMRSAHSPGVAPEAEAEAE